MKNSIDVYFSVEDALNTEKNWNLLYEDPESIYKDVSLNMVKDSVNSFMRCPAFKKVSKNTFVVKNPIRSHFSITDGLITPLSKSYMSIENTNHPSLENNLLVRYGIHFYFFCEEPLNASFTSPYFHRCGYLQYGAMVPGEFDIGRWFRPIHPEINLWENVNELVIEKEEPVFYVSFETDKNVNLKRFTMNSTLDRIAKTCGTSSSWEPFAKISDRYKRFVKSRTDKIVMREIKRNMI